MAGPDRKAFLCRRRLSEITLAAGHRPPQLNRERIDRLLERVVDLWKLISKERRHRRSDRAVCVPPYFQPTFFQVDVFQLVSGGGSVHLSESCEPLAFRDFGNQFNIRYNYRTRCKSLRRDEWRPVPFLKQFVQCLFGVEHRSISRAPRRRRSVIPETFASLKAATDTGPGESARSQRTTCDCLIVLSPAARNLFYIGADLTGYQSQDDMTPERRWLRIVFVSQHLLPFCIHRDALGKNAVAFAEVKCCRGKLECAFYT